MAVLPSPLNRLALLVVEHGSICGLLWSIIAKCYTVWLYKMCDGGRIINEGTKISGRDSRETGSVEDRSHGKLCGLLYERFGARFIPHKT